MALDKVVDSAALDAGMAYIANAIRAKAGTTDKLVWPDGFKAAVEGIQTGSGGISIQSGSFTPAENLSSYTITVDGTVKNFILIKETSQTGYGIRTIYCIEKFQDTLEANILVASNSSGSSFTAINFFDSITAFADGAVLITLSPTNSGQGYLVQEQYNWIAW